MNLDFLDKELNKNVEKNHGETFDKNINNSQISEAEIEVANKLDAVQEFTVDRFEGNIAVLENRKTGEMQNIEKSKLPTNVKEGSILKCINQKYLLDDSQTKNVEERIKNKMDNLWN